jgi:hypothetical protein
MTWIVISDLRSAKAVELPEVIDVSDEPGAEGRVVDGEQFAIRMIACDFRRLGFLLRLTEDSSVVVRVYGSEDGSALAAIDGRGVVLHSLLEDGTIVVTSPPWLGVWRALLFGRPERNHPRAGVHAARSGAHDTLPTHWELHRLRVQRLIARRGRLVAHDDVATLVAIERRLLEVRARRKALALWTGVALGSASMAAAIVYARGVFVPGAVEAGIVGGTLLPVVWTWWIGQHLARLLPFPRRRPARALLGEAPAPGARERARAALDADAEQARAVGPPEGKPYRSGRRRDLVWWGLELVAALGAVAFLALCAKEALALPAGARWSERLPALAGAALALALLAWSVRSASGRLRRVDPVLSLLAWINGSRRSSRLVDGVRRHLEPYLPASSPPGWSAPLWPARGMHWQIVTDAGESLAVTLDSHQKRDAVTVAISPPPERPPVTNARAGEILKHFRNVGAFVEGLVGSGEQGDDPATRHWWAFPKPLRATTHAGHPPPPASRPHDLPAPRGEAMPAYVHQARRHLPEPSPPDWSVPVAFDEEDASGWLLAADDGDFTLIVSIVRVKLRDKLCVTILRPDGEEVTEVQALRLLTHFRDIEVFAPSLDLNGDLARGSPGARMYLGERKSDHPELAPPAKTPRQTLN